MSKKVSLAEIMGKTGAQLGGNGKLSLDVLPDLLGEGMPELPRNSVGRHRLIRSLQQRFGANFRSLPGVKDLVREFDESVRYEKRRHQISQIKFRPTEKGKK